MEIQGFTSMGFFSAKSEHPLADAKELKRTLDSLTGQDAATVLDETSAWLESLTHVDDMKIEQCLDIIFRLDEALQIHTLRLGRDYLVSPRPIRSVEYRLWRCNASYWKHLVAAYEACLARLNSGGASNKKVESLLPLLYIRLMRALAASIKWTQFRYAPMEPSFWSGLGRVYLTALDARIESKAVMVYPNGAESTVEREYLKALMLHSSSINGLMPVEIEIAERLVAYLVPQLVFTDQVHPSNIYWVDPDKSLPPTRLARPPDEVTPTLRFLRPAAALEKIADIRDGIVQGGAVPADLQLGGQYSPEIVLSVLEHLSLQWQQIPPMRIHQRHKVKSRLSVIHGFSSIHDRLMNECDHDIFADTDNPNEEAWIAEDVSVGGMGAQIPLGVNEWIGIGVLIGIQPEGGNNWLIGMIRRFCRGDGAGTVGVQTIGKTPCAVIADGGGLHIPLMLLDKPMFPDDDEREMVNEPALDGGVTSITVDAALPANTFEHSTSLMLSLEGRRLQLNPLFVIERGLEETDTESFVIARFHVELLNG